MNINLTWLVFYMSNLLKIVIRMGSPKKWVTKVFKHTNL